MKCTYPSKGIILSVSMREMICSFVIKFNSWIDNPGNLFVMIRIVRKAHSGKLFRDEYKLPCSLLCIPLSQM